MKATEISAQTQQKPEFDDVLNRFKAYMSYKQYSQAQLARLTGIPASQISMFLSGQIKNWQYLQTLPKFCDINLNWLYTGQGTMVVNEPMPAAPTASIESSQYLDLACLDNIMSRAQEIIYMKPVIVDGEEPDWRKLFFDQMAQNQQLKNELSKILGQLELYREFARKRNAKI